MTDLRKAAEQALEVLEQIQGGCTDSDDGTVEAITVWCPEVVEDLRAALAAEQAPDAEALRAEVDALRMDAERYRWLRRDVTSLAEIRLMSSIVETMCADHMDAAIDAARAQEGK